MRVEKSKQPENTSFSIKYKDWGREEKGGKLYRGAVIARCVF
jgi:hypothetical protein